MSTQLCPFHNDLVFDHSRFPYPSRLICISGKRHLEDPTSQYYGFVSRGETEINWSGGQHLLKAGMYFSLPGDFFLEARGETVVFQRWGYRGLPTLGGPTELDGRLAYIDNSRATILIHPARVGDPVLNLLVFPPNIEQTSHVHPTSRLGVVLSGSGTYVSDERKPLEKGMVFALEPFKVHCFHSGAEGLSVIAFHPDSDVGPTDEVHPMKSRTYLVNKQEK